MDKNRCLHVHFGWWRHHTCRFWPFLTPYRPHNFWLKGPIELKLCRNLLHAPKLVPKKFLSPTLCGSKVIAFSALKRGLSYNIDVPRSFDTEHVPYSFLEDIKDGKAISSKYNSKELKFVTPNIVIVFSNGAPCAEELSSDRWMRYNIRGNELNLGVFSKKKK